MKSCQSTAQRKLAHITSNVNTKKSVNLNKKAAAAPRPHQQTVHIARKAGISKLSDCPVEIVEGSKAQTKCKKLNQFSPRLESSNKHSCINSPINKVRIVKGNKDDADKVLNYANLISSVIENETREIATSAFESKFSSGGFSSHPNKLIITELRGKIKPREKRFHGSSRKASRMEEDANDLLACLTESKNVSLPNKHLNVNELEDWISPDESKTNNMSAILSQDLQNLTSKFGQAWMKHFFQKVDEGMKNSAINSEAHLERIEENIKLGRCQVVTPVSKDKSSSLIHQPSSTASQEGLSEPKTKPEFIDLTDEVRFAKKSRTDDVTGLVGYRKFNNVDHIQTRTNTESVELHVSESFGKVKMTESPITFNHSERETLEPKKRISIEAKPDLDISPKKLQSKYNLRRNARKNAVYTTIKQTTKTHKGRSKKRRIKESNLGNIGDDIKLACSEVLRPSSQKENESLTITEPNPKNRQGADENQSEMLLEHSPKLEPNQCGSFLKHNSSHFVHQPTDNQRGTASKLEIESILINFDSSNEEKFKKEPQEDDFVGLLGYRRLEQLVLIEDGPDYEVVSQFEPVELIYVPEDRQEVNVGPSTSISENKTSQTVAQVKLKFEEKSDLLQSKFNLRIKPQLDMKVVGKEDTPNFGKRKNIRKTKLIARVDEEESASKPTMVINPLNKHLIKGTTNKGIGRHMKSVKLEDSGVSYSVLKEHSYSLHYDYFLAQVLNLDALKYKAVKKKKSRPKNEDKSLENSLIDNFPRALELEKFHVVRKRKHVLNETAKIIQTDEDTQHMKNYLNVRINQMENADLKEIKNEKHTNEGSAKQMKYYPTLNANQIKNEGIQKTETEKKIQTDEGALDPNGIELTKNYIAGNVKQMKNVNLKRNKAKKQKQTNQDSAKEDTIIKDLKLTGSDRTSHYSVYKKKVKEIARMPDPASATNSAADVEISSKFKVYKYSTQVDIPLGGVMNTENFQKTA